MTSFRRAARPWLRLEPAAALLSAAALLAAVPALGQGGQRQPHSSSSREGSSSDGGRHAVPSDGGGRSYGGPSASDRSSNSGGDRSSHDGGGRTARPAGPGGGGGHDTPSRQPPTRDPRGSHGHGGSGGGRFGGYYGYYGSPYYNDPFYSYWGPYPYYWWGGSGYPYVYGPGGAYTRSEGRYNERGALDMDVWPGDTQVYLDGEYIGSVDSFDGWPQYLWLEKGTYDVVLYRKGYQSVAKQISVYPGVVIDVNDRLEPGDSTAPEKMLTPRSTERRDARIRADREREQELRSRRGGDDDWDSWRDRIRRDEPRRDRHESDDADDRDADGGLLQLEVEPDDASIYVDGHFVGTAEQVNEDDSDGLPVPPGQHKISAVRPGRSPKEVTVDVEAGAKVRVRLDLDSSN
jgi:hypothetical protein